MNDWKDVTALGMVLLAIVALFVTCSDDTVWARERMRKTFDECVDAGTDPKWCMRCAHGWETDR